MVSVFRAQKLNYVFDTFLDVTQDGSIAQDDFQVAIEKIASTRGYTQDDDNYIDLSDRFVHFWTKLQMAADTDGDCQVSRTEWVDLWSNSVSNGDWKILYMEFMFDLQDWTGDGTIDEDEFIQFCTAFGVPIKESKNAYGIISKKGTKKIDFSYYSELWKQYFMSDDVDAIGNYIFGKNMAAAETNNN